MMEMQINRLMRAMISADLCDFITGLGHNPIMSESIDFPVNPHISTMKNYVNAVRDEADLLVLIIGNRYGSLLDSGKSITNTEFITAVRKGIPVYTFTYKPLATREEVAEFYVPGKRLMKLFRLFPGYSLAYMWHWFTGAVVRFITQTDK